MAISPPFIPQTQVLGSLMASSDAFYWDTWFKYPELFRIIECESQWNPLVCNQQYGCKAGMGLGQIIPSTLEYCEIKLEKELDPFNAQDNFDCSLWLYLNEGIRHWEKWSGHCFK